VKVAEKHYLSLWWNDEQGALQIIDQRSLPHLFVEQDVTSMQDYVDAITQMRVRGAPLIGAVAA